MARNDTTIDWHMKCSKDMKKCVLYEDKEEKFPAVEFRMKDGYVEIERISTISSSPLVIEGKAGRKLIDYKVELGI